MFQPRVSQPSQPVHSISEPDLPRHHPRRRAAVAALLLWLMLWLMLALAACAPFGSGGASSQANGVQPTPTSASQGQLAHAVLLAVWGTGVRSLTTSYDATHESATVTITLDGTVPNTRVKVSAAQELTKAFCLMALQALWTSGVPLESTLVVVQGPTQDEYANIITQQYGVVTLEASVARRIDWNVVTADGAWQQYDHEFLRSSFTLIA